jgi:hypothetical protein
MVRRFQSPFENKRKHFFLKKNSKKLLLIGGNARQAPQTLAKKRFFASFFAKKEVLSLIQNPLQNVSGTDTVTKAEAPVSVK